MVSSSRTRPGRREPTPDVGRGVDSELGAVRAEPSYLRPVARAFVLIALVLSLVVWWSHTHQRPAEEGVHPTDRPHLATGDAALGGWLWYDAWWYHDIAVHHYADGQAKRFNQGRQSAAPFFPAYPLVVDAVGWFVGDLALAQVVSTFLLGLAAVLLFARWCRARLPRRATLLASAALLVYPYAWYLYGSGYADALLLVATIGAFLLVEGDRPLLAGIAGMVATAARPTGALVVLGLAAVALERRGTLTHDPTSRLTRGWRLHPERFDRRDVGVLLAVGGVIAYALFVWHVFHDPLAFVHAERAWHQPQGLVTWLKLQLVKDITRHPITWWARLVAQALLALGFAMAARSVARRFGWGYGAYALLMAVVPAWSTADFMGTGRYLIACFPVFAVVGAHLAERRWPPVLLLAPSAITLGWLTSLFARGFYLS